MLHHLDPRGGRECPGIPCKVECHCTNHDYERDPGGDLHSPDCRCRGTGRLGDPDTRKGKVMIRKVQGVIDLSFAALCLAAAATALWWEFPAVSLIYTFAAVQSFRLGRRIL